MLGVLLVVILASVTVVYVYQQQNPPPNCTSPLGNSKILRTTLPAPTVIGGITEFSLPGPLRNPNAPVVAPDGSVWFGEQAVAGIAHFYPGNMDLGGIRLAVRLRYSAKHRRGLR